MPSTAETTADLPTLGPVQRWLWRGEGDCGAKNLHYEQPSDLVARVFQESLAVVARRRAAGSLYNAKNKLADETFAELAAVGYWGLLIPREYGGAGGTLTTVLPFLTQMAVHDPTVAGLQNVHACIGPVQMLLRYGTPEQRQKFLPLLASGDRIGVFGLTEPNAGTDLTALRTTAVREGEKYLVTGEKLFLTNLLPGRLLALICLIDGSPAALLVDLPPTETPEFQLVRYGLHSLQHTHNHGCVLRELAVPVENRLEIPTGGGLQAAYHGLNRGRVALCANAAGTLRLMLANLLPWTEFRHSGGKPLASYQLVRQRVARLEELIRTCDALTLWGATLLDGGVRAEAEAIIIKTFAAEALREAAIDICLRTHGGRAFLAGHHLGDHLHDYLAPCIYEGENQILLLALFKSLVKPHVREFYEPLEAALRAAKLPKLPVGNPFRMWRLRSAWMPLWRWRRSTAQRARQADLAGEIAPYALQIDSAVARHGRDLAHEQQLLLSLAEGVAGVVVRQVMTAAPASTFPLVPGEAAVQPLLRPYSPGNA
ncbi:MAG: acyl-CoA dehydrogenase family protein [Pirellulales bacterium]|nr:acyl-CoA dehydrogenase family protein [Pirellulales bacterium]